MAWEPRTHEREPNIDPFNAPDPIMPGGEPEFEPPRERPDADDGVGRMVRRNERKEPGHGKHRPQRSWRSLDSTPSSADSGPVSPIREEEDGARHAQGKQQDLESSANAWRARKAAKRRSGDGSGWKKRSSRLGCLIAFIFMLAFSGIVSTLFESCSSCVDSVFFEDTYEDDYDDTYYDYDSDAYWLAQDDLKAATEEVTVSALEAAREGDVAYREIVASAFADAFTKASGVEPESIGLDTLEISELILSNITYDIDSIYAFGDATEDGFVFSCSSYFDFTIPSARDLGYQVGEFVLGLVPDASASPSLSVDDQLAVKAYVEQELEHAEVFENYSSMEFAATADAEGAVLEGPVLDSQDWLDNFAGMVGAYDYLD